jgi:hypothetical protein
MMFLEQIWILSDNKKKDRIAQVNYSAVDKCSVMTKKMAYRYYTISFIFLSPNMESATERGGGGLGHMYKEKDEWPRYILLS